MMITTHPCRDISNQDLVAIRALSSIRSEQADTIEQAVRASGLPWSVQTIDDYDGYLSILIEPTVSDNEQKTFFVSGTAQHLELFEVYGDNMTSVVTFIDVERMLVRLLDVIGQQ